ncbi:MAG: hypothetical protein IH621_12445 [Krumholzibacteria bacterium]|nr:hypothetical protein [Candidatus Krumholzibacteria bacterium]
MVYRFRAGRAPRPLVALAMALAVAVTAARGSAPAAAGTDGRSVTSYEVKRQETRAPELPSLRFLRANRAFLRSRLDRLLLQTTHTRDGRAAAVGGLLASVTGLADLEAELDLMQALLDEQGARLGWLEADYLGRQETALVLLVRAGRGDGPPAGMVVTDDDRRLRVGFSAEQRSALAQGGVVQVLHELVEPRRHELAVVFLDAQGDTLEAQLVPVDAARDRLTFVEVEPAAGAAVWRR